MHRFQSPEKRFPKPINYPNFLFSSHSQATYRTSLSQVLSFFADPPPMFLAQGLFRSVSFGNN
ncbi:hypothetical protein V6Z11_D13G161800 [Gossypium hirsutum]